MTTTSADPAAPAALVVVDTNVLLAATDRGRARHDAATRFLNEDRRRLAVFPQIVREYIAVATRPADANGLGLASEDAAANVKQLLEDVEMLSEGPSTTRILIELIADGAAAGKQVHDANVVAVAMAHSATAIVTDNTRHFARFSKLIAVEQLATNDLSG